MGAESAKKTRFQISSRRLIRAPNWSIRAPNSRHQKLCSFVKNWGPNGSIRVPNLPDGEHVFEHSGTKLVGSGADFDKLINRKTRFQSKDSWF